MKQVKKCTLIALAVLTLGGSLSSCATVFGGKVVESQRRKPAAGEPARELKMGALIADILLFPIISLPVDFATKAIYKPRGTARQTEPAKATASPSKK